MSDWKATQAARASAAKALQAAFPALVAVGGKVDSLNAAAKNIRIELKAAFPKVKFSVKSSRFSGGDSITVSWVDGPTTEQVDPIIERYEAGSFDGMTDCYNYSRSAWKEAFGDAKYISSSRSYSDAAVAGAIRTVFAKYPGNMESLGISGATVEDWRNNKLWQVDVLGGGYGNRSDLQSLVSTELSRRTWALCKSAPANMLEAEVV